MNIEGASVRTLLFGAALLAVAAAVPFIGALDYPFLHDDMWAVVDNPLVDDGVDPARIFASNSWGNRPEYPHMHYRPLSVLTLSVTHALFGEAPAPFRLTNTAMHAAVTVLLFLLLIRLSVRPIAAFAGSLWFAVHPVHVEAVMFAVNREELMATLFYLGAVHVMVPSLGISGIPARPMSAARMALVCLLMALGFLSKETAATLPVLVLAISLWWPLRPRLAWPRAMALTGALFLTLVACLTLRYEVLGRVLSSYLPWQDNPLVLVHGFARVWSALGVLAESARLMVAPFYLTVDYGYNVLGFPSGGRFLASVAGLFILVGAVFAVFRLARTSRVASLGLLLALVSWLPFSNLLFPNSIILSERTLYLPSAGVAICLAGLLDGFSDPVRGSRVVGNVLAAAVFTWCLMMGAVAHDRVLAHRSAVSLFGSSLANRPGSTRLHDNLGLAYMKEGHPAKSEEHLRRALAIDPTNAAAHNNLGLLLGGTGRAKEAAMEFSLALRLRPAMEEALTNLCWLLVRTGEYEAALKPCAAARRKGGPVDDALRLIEAKGSSGRE